LTSIEMEELHDYEVVELCSGNGYHKLWWKPQGSKALKEDQKNAKFKECVLCAQTKTNVDMVVATMKV
jgi:hypothetical protein